MKRTLWASIIICAVSMLSSAAHATSGDSLFESFLHDCADHAGDASAPLNAVSQQGWTPIPDQELQAKIPPFNVPGFKTDWYHAYTNALPGRAAGLFAGRGVMFSGTSLGPVPASFCMVMQKPIDLTVFQRASFWVAVKKASGDDNTVVYLFSQAPNGRQATGPQQFLEAFRAGSGRELVVMSHPGENTSGVMIVAPIMH